MRTGGATLLTICGLLAALPAGAQATSLKPGISPRAVAWLGAPPACPSAEAVDGRSAAQGARDLITGKTKVSDDLGSATGDDTDDVAGVFLGVIALSLVTDTPAAVVTVCDPGAAAGGQPLGTITGDARDVPDAEQIGAGLRSRGGTFGRATGAAAIGDRFVLPPSGAGSLIDVAVDTTNGAARLRVGPTAAPPVALRIDGQLEAPQVVVEYADGSSSTHAVTPPAPVSTTVEASTTKDTLVLKVKTAPGAFVAASATDPTSTDSMDAFSDPADLQVVGDGGAANVRLGPLAPGMRLAETTIIDAQRRSIDSWACKLRWAKTRLRSVTCSGGPDTSERPRIGAPTADRLARAPRASRDAVPGSHTAAPGTVAHGAAALQLAPIAATAMFRARGAAASELTDMLEEATPFFADVTGDGRPESTVGDGLSEPAKLLVSAAGGGWRSVRMRHDGILAPDLLAAGDLNGDGIEELWARTLDNTSRAIAGSATWSSTPPRVLDVRASRPGPRDLLLGSGAFGGGDTLPRPLPDSTGDGRPELGVVLGASPAHSGLATFASDDAPLGQRWTPPSALLTDPSSVWDALSGKAPAAVFDPDTPTVRTPDGLVWVAPVADVAGKRRTTLVRLAGDGRSFAPLPAFSSAGVPSLAGFDPASGELLVTTTAEACVRRKGCVSRVLRVDATGRTLGGIALRGSGDVTAHFVDDGPDADTRGEVVVRDQGSDFDDGGKRTVPGTGRTIARWDSATGSPAWKRLPVLAVGGTAVRPSGPLLGWTSASGKHHVGTWSLRGKGRKRSAVLLDLTVPK